MPSQAKSFTEAEIQQLPPSNPIGPQERPKLAEIRGKSGSAKQKKGARRGQQTDTQKPVKITRYVNKFSLDNPDQDGKRRFFEQAYISI